MSCASIARQKVALPSRPFSSCRARVRRSERRHFPRYEVSLPILLADGVGQTCNISEIGVLFETDRPFELMEPIEFDLVLEEFDPERPYRMRCQGSVVRVESSEAVWRVAAVIDRYTLPCPQD